MTGFIIVNKEKGNSSAREVSAIRRLTGTPCGHLGTLDPMADGVLPVAIGNAARLFDYFLDKKKTYVATFQFGIETDTLDTTGSVLSEGDRIPCEADVQNVIPSLVGEILQVPPKYSAKCVNGKRGYQLARAGVEFALPPKMVKIYSIELLEKSGVNSYRFKIECGGGTYIRSIARDMAAALHTTAVMSALTRTASGVFTLDQAVETRVLTKENIQNYVIPTESVLPYASVYPSEDDAKRLFNGLAVKCDLEDGAYKIFTQNKCFYGIATVNGGFLKVRTKLC